MGLLQALPLEVLLMIWQCLAYFDRKSLMRTSKQIAQLLPSDDVPTPLFFHLHLCQSGPGRVSEIHPLIRRHGEVRQWLSRLITTFLIHNNYQHPEGTKARTELRPLKYTRAWHRKSGVTSPEVEYLLKGNRNQSFRSMLWFEKRMPSERCSLYGNSPSVPRLLTSGGGELERH